MPEDPRTHEIDANYDYLQRTLALLLPQHEGQYALLKGCTIVDFFDRPGDAYRAALEPLDLGFFSYAGA